MNYFISIKCSYFISKACCWKGERCEKSDGISTWMWFTEDRRYSAILSWLCHHRSFQGKIMCMLCWQVFRVR